MLSEKIVKHLKQSSMFLAYVETHKNRRLLRHALGFKDDSKPRTERLAKEKGLPGHVLSNKLRANDEWCCKDSFFIRTA